MDKAPSQVRHGTRRIALGVAIAVFLVTLGIALVWPDRYRVTVAMALETPGRPPGEPTSVTTIPIWLPDPYGFPSPWRIDFARVDAFLVDIGTGGRTAVAEGSETASATGGPALGQTKQQLLSLGRTVLGRRPLAALTRALGVFPDLAGDGGSTGEVVRRMSRDLRVAVQVSVFERPERARLSGSPGMAFARTHASVSGLSLSFAHEDPGTARRVVGQLADEFVESLNAARITGPSPPTRETQAWLASLANTRRQAIVRLQNQLAGMKPDDPRYPELEQTLIDAASGLAALEARLLALEQERRCRTGGCARRVRRLDEAALPVVRVGPPRVAVIGLGALAACLSGLGIMAVASAPRRRFDAHATRRRRGADAPEAGED
jgi:hypothetical protein